jgi:RHS repeat-associated protein
MLASSFLDPVLGIDIHFEMVPTPAPVPTPIPNPFIGLVFDPIGLAAGIAIGAAIGAVMGAPFQGPVLYWTAFPATNTGTEAKHVPGHILIPPGVAWAPFPKTPKPVIHPGETPKPALPVKPENDAVVITGSKTVTVMGSNAARLGDIALSCSEPLRLPSSVVLAIPKGAPILIGGPPSLDIMAALLASLRTRFVSDSLHALLSRLKPSRFRNLLNRVVCFFTGHPVDVASGKVMTEFVDAELPGPLPLRVERIYSSAFAARPGPVGHGWSLSLDQGVWRERGKVVLLSEDGREIEFDTFDFPQHRIEPGQRVYHPIERLTLHCEKDDAWRVVDREGIVREFAPVPGRTDGRAMIQRIRSRCGYHEITFHYSTGGTKGAGASGSFTRGTIDAGTRDAALGRLEWVRDSTGRFVHLRHDASGRVTELHLPKPHGEGFHCHRRYEYDTAGDLVSVTDPLGHAWRFAYVTHLLTQETDRNGLSFYFAYDGLGEDAWCVRTWGDGGIHDHVLGYDKHKHITFVTDSLGFTTQYHMNLVGQVVKIVDPLGAVTHYEYDPTTLAPTKEIDALGRVTSHRYDARGNPIAAELPDGAAVDLVWDESNRLQRAVDPNGQEWSWRYDARGRLIERKASDGSLTRYHYDGGRLAVVRDARGGETRLAYDGQGMLARIQAPDLATVSYRHDALGRMVQRTDPLGHVQSRHLDLLGRATEVRESHGNVRALAYDPEGNVVHDRDGAQDVRFTWTGRRRVGSRSEGGTTVRFEYDSEQRLRTITNEVGSTYRFDRDERGHVKQETGFDGAPSACKRDAEGQLAELRRPSGATTRYRHDAAGRVVEIEHADGTKDSFQYRADGELVEARNAETTIRFERDAVGRVLREQQDEHWIESTYDPRGFRVRVRSSFGAIQQLERNPLGDVTELRYWDAAARSRGGPGVDPLAPHWAATIERDLSGQERERHLPGGLRSHWERDELGRPLRHQLGNGRTLLRDVVHEWGPDERLHRIVHPGKERAVSYGYDPRGILAWADYGDGHADVRMPDAAGNLFRRQDLRDREYGPAGQLVFAATSNGGARRYAYDDDGNLLERHDPDGGVWRYTWSAAGNLVEVERPDGKKLGLAYDALGRRIKKTFEGKTTRWVWDGDVPLHEWVEGGEAPAVARLTAKVVAATTAPPNAGATTTGGAGTNDEPERTLVTAAPRPPAGEEAPEKTVVTAPPGYELAPPGLVTWVFEPGTHSPAAKIAGDERFSIVCDLVGAPVAMLDERGDPVWSAELGAYGQLRELETAEGFDRSACPLRWPGQYEDAETGLHYNRHRYYDPDSGQYISQDRLGIRAGLAAYAYVADPLTTTDALGLITGPPYDFGELMNAAQNDLDFKTAPDGAVFWSGPRMKDAQAWAAANGKTTLEQTRGGQTLDSLKLFDPGSGLTGAQAAEVWDAASLRFAKEASGEVSVFSTGAKRMNNWGNLRTWWRVERPALKTNTGVTRIVRRKKDGAPCT